MALTPSPSPDLLTNETKLFGELRYIPSIIEVLLHRYTQAFEYQ